MGWTSKEHNGTLKHLEFENHQAVEFIHNEFRNYEIIGLYVHKAKDKYDHNEIYVAMTYGENTFVCCILVDIIDDEILWKEIPESMGPAYHNCPTDLLEFNIPEDEYSKVWRGRIRSKAANRRNKSLFI